jgi:hypothetical protein
VIDMRINNMFGSLVLAGALLCCIPAGLQANPRVRIVVTVRVAPPVLPIYAQPICPGPGYIWEPGYWAYGDEGYYWVPGTWVLPPTAGLLWTPGYWEFSDGLYAWRVGYWGPTVGFYGGINYGFGYPGRGFYGGYWRDGQYFYNSRVTNVNRVVVHNVYSTTFVNERSANRISFNGGAHGIQARPTSAELSAIHAHHVAMTSAQIQHQEGAKANRTYHGRPAVTAVARPAALNNRRELPNRSVNNRVANTERPTARNPRAPVHETASATKAAPARSERPSVARPSPTHSPAPPPSHPNNTPTHRPATSAPKPSSATHTQKPAVRQPAAKPTPRGPHEQSPSNSHPSQHHAAAPHASPPHAVTNEQSHVSGNEPRHPDHQ